MTTDPNRKKLLKELGNGRELLSVVLDLTSHTNLCPGLL